MTDPISFGWKENTTRGPLSDPADGPTRTLGTTKTLAVMQCHGTNVGPLGTLRGGAEGVTSGVPFAFAQNQRGEVVTSDYAHQLNTGGGTPGEGYPAAHIGATVRRLTPTECERLMGWPDDHTRWRSDGTEVADSVRYRMCGNGVASPVAEWLATQLNRTLEH